jgi:nicotinate-nucleotide adenylyltransferase
MRLGIFGGSFDPVHNGHLCLAHECQRQVALDEVWFTPVAIQPLKKSGPQAADHHRLQMLNRAIDSQKSEPSRGHDHNARVAPRESWRVCTLEIDRGGFSYTVDTLRRIHEELPDAELFFLVGADALRDVPQWREPQEIFRLSTPLVVCRPGQSMPDLSALGTFCDDQHKPQQVEMNPIDVSSSEIRRRIAAGEPIDHLTPPAVAEYIAGHGLYR